MSVPRACGRVVLTCLIVKVLSPDSISKISLKVTDFLKEVKISEGCALQANIPVLQLWMLNTLKIVRDGPQLAGVWQPLCDGMASVSGALPPDSCVSVMMGRNAGLKDRALNHSVLERLEGKGVDMRRTLSVHFVEPSGRGRKYTGSQDALT